MITWRRSQWLGTCSAALIAAGLASDRASEPNLALETTVGAGERVFTAKGCAACHAPGRIVLQGQSLNTPAQIRSLVEAPQNANMPAFNLTDVEAQALAAYLASRFP